VSERRRRKALVRRLGDKRDSVRDAEIDALVGCGHEAVPALTRVLRGVWLFRRRVFMATAAALGRIGGQEAVNTLLWTLAVLDWRARYVTRVGLPAFGVLVAFSVYFAVLTGVPPYEVLVGPLLVIAVAFLAVRGSAVQALGVLREPRAVGQLAVSHEHRSLRKLAGPVLKELMPKVQDAHVSSFSGSQRGAVLRLLRQEDLEMVRGALHVTSLFGTEDARAGIEGALADGPPSLREPAERALAEVNRRLALAKDKASLLRASSGDTEEAGQLLRPAAGAEDPDQQQLLRRPDSEDV
jgi:HEAT repeat protein